MLKLNRLMIATLLVCLAGPALAAGKIAVIDIQGAILQTDVAKKRIEEMKRSKDYKADRKSAEKIRDDGAALVKKLQKDGPVMGQAQQADLQKRIQEKQADIEHIARKLQSKEQEVMKGLMMQYQARAKDAVNELIKTEKIGLLLDSRSALHAEPAYNITAKLTEKLNKAR